MSAQNATPSPADAQQPHGHGGHELPGAFEENDKGETPLPYGEGGIPFYITIAWVSMIVAYIVYMVMWGLPDFSQWGAP